LTVHIFNPNVPEADVQTFLRRFVDIQGEGRKVIDEENVWTSKWRYMARFRSCDTAEGGVLVPPANFFIGSNKGYLTYPGQPKTCRKCGEKDHFAIDCQSKVCRRCGRVGHIAMDCVNPLVCNLCGEQGHTYRMCSR
ncbi:ZCHC3 protein, partial [Atractosteus spatula]|nr:ZCHC3 protein [Atractosteus spatula]